MTRLAERKTRLVFETSDSVFERSQSRQIVIEARPAYCIVRLKGQRRGFPICYAAIYSRAVQMAAEDSRRAKSAVKKAGRK